MKKKTYLVATVASACFLALTSCNNPFNKKDKNKDNEPVAFDFAISLASGKTSIEVGLTDQIKISSNLTDDTVSRVYTYETSNSDRMTVDTQGVISALEEGSVKITVSESNSGVEKELDLTVIPNSHTASGGFNYSALGGADAIAKRTEILGKLEKYAVESHLTGITLFENGGYVKYNTRLEIPAKEYITGYGFGILSDGDINADLATEENAAYKRYYHSAQTSNPNTVNAWNATGSQVSDLSSYITSSYWGTKMNEDKTGYEWYPVLALDKVNGKTNSRPIPVYDTENPLQLYKTWKIYVKTGHEGLAYRYSGSKNASAFENRPVALEDYAFVYQLLLTGVSGMIRGSEMAADKTYGIRGAQEFFNLTKREDITQAEIDALWSDWTQSASGRVQDQKLGIKTGSDTNGSYIILDILNEIDAFTAMYTLSSSLVSPVPRDFIQDIAGSGKALSFGAKSYGKNDTTTHRTLLDNVISLGAYKLDVWSDEYIVFGRNDSWVERTTYPDRYKIKGVHIRTFDNASQEDLYMKFKAGWTDSTGIPQNYLDQEIGQPDVRSTKGDSTFKLNVNSCTQAQWDKLFGPNGTVKKNSSWNVKPWMSNNNFLNGLYWSINRSEFAKNRGVQPSINYFADSYLSDPENGRSYNDTPEHKKAVAKWHTVYNGKDNYGYDYTKAVECFKNAVNELVASNAFKLGTAQKPTEISIHIRWMYQTDETEYGNDIVKYFTDAFNDPQVSSGRVKLKVVQEAVTNWEDVYNEWMMKGQFDLAFGAISGNTYNPLNFLEVLRSDNSSGFTLNWGTDTHALDENNPIIYDGQKWSFDALWEVSDRGGIVENGVSVPTVRQYNFDGLAQQISGGNAYDYSVGINQSINFELSELDGVSIEVTKVQVYVVGGNNHDVTSYSIDKTNKKLSITIDAAKGATIRNQLNDIYNKDKQPADEGYIDPSELFTRDQYAKMWTYEVYYNLSIAGGAPSQSFVTLVTRADQQVN